MCECLCLCLLLAITEFYLIIIQGSVEKNAKEIKEYIEEIYWGSNKRVLLLGHSKGGVDTAAALSLYWSDLKDKVAGLALAQSPYGGSPIASDLLREGQLGDYVNLRKLTEILICRIMKVCRVTLSFYLFPYSLLLDCLARTSCHLCIDLVH